MLAVKRLWLLATSARVITAILEGVGRTDLEVVRIRLEEEKAKRLLLQNDVEVLMLQVEELKRKCDQRDKQGAYVNISLVNHGVAFTATLLSDTKYVSEQTVIFDHIIVNEGNCNDSSTGRFKAPVRGLSSFSVTVLTGGLPQHVHLFIMKDKEEIGRVYSGDGTGSVMVVTVMEKGQVVFVKEIPGYSETVHGGHWSTFTGFLLDRCY
ncbi:hypothetical protein ACJMK2_023270 [Sinanodonta woodiana]|uniref:C1q domain-containing protein n=1 Tax=Sinanodonta woodiana TaxID=1069815 RepID=A0ABD3T3N4_SINWO